MSSSYSKSYDFDVRGTTDVPQPSHWHYLGTLYDGKGENAKVVRLPDLVKADDVPKKVSYTREVAVDIKVDGRPFDASVSSCCNEVERLTGSVRSLTGEAEALSSGVSDLTSRVNVLTASVVGLTTETGRAAVGISDAKSDAANKIADSLVSGFSFYVRRMIADKIRELRATIPGKASTFGALAKNLGERQQQLKDDYERITGRYSGYIEQLNESLEGRLRELDRPAFANCAEMSAVIFRNPFGFVLGESICAGGEQQATAAAVRVSHVKDATTVAMGEVSEYVKTIRRLSAAVGDTLTEHREVGRRTLSVPVVRLEGDALPAQNDEGRKLFMPTWFEGHCGKGSERISQRVFDRLEGRPEAEKSEAELRSIDGCFRQRMTEWVAAARETGGRDPRVVEKIVALWEQSKGAMRG